MMPEREANPLTADEHLKFTAIIENATYSHIRRALSDSVACIGRPQARWTADAFQRRAHQIWRTSLPG
jgi:hypothetical protein